MSKTRIINQYLLNPNNIAATIRQYDADFIVVQLLALM